MSKIDPTALPIDRVAARVIGKGVAFDPNFRIPAGMHHADRPPEYKPIPNEIQWIDLRGKRFNKLTVTGWLGRKQGKVGKWAVRCDCGIYETRTTPALKNGEPMQMQCLECEYLEKVRRGLGHRDKQDRP